MIHRTWRRGVREGEEAAEGTRSEWMEVSVRWVDQSHQAIAVKDQRSARFVRHLIRIFSLLSHFLLLLLQTTQISVAVAVAFRFGDKNHVKRSVSVNRKRCALWRGWYIWATISNGPYVGYDWIGHEILNPVKESGPVSLPAKITMPDLWFQSASRRWPYRLRFDFLRLTFRVRLLS